MEKDNKSWLSSLGRVKSPSSCTLIIDLGLPPMSCKLITSHFECQVIAGFYDIGVSSIQKYPMGALLHDKQGKSSTIKNPHYARNNYTIYDIQCHVNYL